MEFDLSGLRPFEDQFDLTGLQPLDPLRENNALARVRQGVGDITGAAVGEFVSGFGRGIEGIGDLNQAAANAIVRGIRALGADGVADFLTETRIPQPVDKFINPTTVFRNAGQAITSIGGTASPPAERQNTATDIAGATGQLTGQILTAVAGGPGAATALLVGQGASIGQDIAEEEGQAGTAAGDLQVFASTGITALSERIGLDAILNRVPPAIKNNVLRRLTDIAIGGGIEAAQEVAEGVLNNLSAKFILDSDRPILEGLEREAIAAGGAGAIARSVLATGLPGRQSSLTQEDRESPIPDDIIAEGKDILGGAESEGVARSALREAGLPDVGQRVSVTAPNGAAAVGTLARVVEGSRPADAVPLFDDVEIDRQVGFFDPASGRTFPLDAEVGGDRVIIQFDDGSVLVRKLSELQTDGLRIRPIEQLPAPPQRDVPLLPAPRRSGATTTAGDGFVLQGDEAPQRALAAPVQPVDIPAQANRLPAPERGSRSVFGEGFEARTPTRDVPALPAPQATPGFELGQGFQFRDADGVDAPILRRDGTPFTTARSAELAARQRGDLRGRDLQSVEVPGGFGLAETPAPSRPFRNELDVSGLTPARPDTQASPQPAATQQADGVVSVDPNTLIFSETDQNRTSEVESRFPAGEPLPPIVTINDGGERTIIDGGNRARVAQSRGENLAAVDISRVEFDQLTAQGFDPVEISYAALSRAGQDDAASLLARQFPGANVAERGFQAEAALDALANVQPTTEPSQQVRLRKNGEPFKTAAGALLAARQNPALRGLQPVEVPGGFGLADVPAQPRSERQRRPQDVLRFLAQNGGIRDDEGFALRRGRDLQRFIPGAGNLIRNRGRSIDAAGELLHEAGFFGPPTEVDRPTESEVLDLIEDAAFRTVVRPDDAANLDELNQSSRTVELNEVARESVRGFAQSLNETFTDAEINEILEEASRQDGDIEAAVFDFVERLAIRDADAIAQETGDDSFADIPFEPAQAGRDAGTRRGGPARDQENQRTGQPERTAVAQDRQSVIPGAERITDRELAERRAQQPLRPTTPQRPADDGLFDVDGRSQQDLPLNERFSVAQPLRSAGIPQSAGQTLSTFTQASDVSRHKDFVAAKAGDVEAAQRLVRDLVGRDTIALAQQRFGSDVVFAPVIAEERSGRNRIPHNLARMYANSLNAQFEARIVQSSRAFHTGADPMERLVSRPTFDGPVQSGGRYVLVDDVTVMGGTLAELANHIQAGGGEVVGIVTLANASRVRQNAPRPVDIRIIEGRFGDVVRQEFSIEPSALTAAEAQYLVGFRDADELRNRIAKARRDQDGRDNRQSIRRSEAQDRLRLARSLRAEFSENFADIQAGLTARLKAVGIADRVTVRLVNNIVRPGIDGIEGRYSRGVIEVALTSRDPNWTLDHEIVHALREFGLFTNLEWRTLERFVKSDAARMADVRRRNEQLALTEEQIVEEAVADAYADFAAGSTNRRTNRLFNRIRRFFQGVSSALRGGGFRSAEDVFTDIDAGVIGRRGGQSAGAEKFSLNPTGKNAAEPGDVGRLKDDKLNLVKEAKAGRIGEAIDRWRTNFQDQFLPLLRTQQSVEQRLGRVLGEVENPYLGQELMSGRIGAQLEALTEDKIRPLFDQMAKENVSVEELETFLYARHAPERNAHIARINPEFDGPGSGMSDAEAAAIMRGVESSGKKAALDRLAARVDGFLKDAVDTRVKAGLMTQAEADAWRQVYKNYVPLRGEAELDPELNHDRPRRGSGINITGKESQRAFGRQSKAVDILAHAMLQAEEAIIRAETNRVGVQFVELARAAPDPDFWTIDKINRRPVFNKSKGIVEFRSDSRVAAEDRDFTITAKINGTEHRVTLNRRNADAVRLAESMRNLKGQQIGPVLQTLGQINRYLSSVNTTLNPEFIITNAFRDLQTAGINLNKFNINGLAKKTLRDYPAALGGAMRGSFNRKADGEWVRWFNEFVDEGGRVFFNRTDDINELVARVEREFKAAQPGLSARKAVTAIFNTIERANLGVENAIRLAAFKNAREAGMSKAEAASLAKNLTVNFNRRGAYGPLMNSMFLFYNASVQGSAVILSAIKSPRVRKILAGAVAAGALLEALNMLISEDDDDGQSFYDKISDFDKSRNLVLMVPGGNGKHVKIPLPYGYNVFFALGRSAVEIGRGRPAGRTLSSFAATMVDAFNPVGGTESILNFLAPTVVDPVVDLVRNRDFADRPIRPEQPPFGPPIPENQRYWSSVSPIWRSITSTLNEITGGDEVRPGVIDVSPEVLDHLFGVATGAAGTFFQRNADLVAKLADPSSEITFNDIPLGRKVFGGKPSWFDKGAFFERAKEIEAAEATFKGYLETGNRQAAREFEAQNRDVLSLSRAAKVSRQQAAKIRRARNQVHFERDQGRISADTAQEQLKAIKEREDAIIQRFNKLYVEEVLK